ncbi:SpoIIE family protein phosphatase [Streptomyces sp. NBC_01224]|uniref:SpoIIE family protein phosphatase n=1 Tax=Streptomyces sp. NBC_01224 TaxID=2903783 RepID=UPI002E0F802A|nr:SpoIIE family protein phosphatase [Streptomyces sp. NBC_01224]
MVIPLSVHASQSVSRKGLSANQLAAARAREFVCAALHGWTAELADGSGASATDATPDAGAAPAPVPIPGEIEELVDDAVLLVSELVTNAVMYAGTDIDVVCRLERNPVTRVGVVVEVVDRHPSRGVRGPVDTRHGEPGFGLQLVNALSESWGVTYRRAEKRVWFRLEVAARETPVTEPASSGPGTAEPGSDARSHDAGPPVHPAHAHGYTPEWTDRGGPSFLAETSELLAGQLDEAMVTALAAQMLVPRLADWCGIWLSTPGRGLQLSRVWHADEQRIAPLREELERIPPPAALRSGGTPWPWPESAGADRAGGSAFAFPLVARDTDQGVLLLGRAGQSQMTDTVVRMVQDVARRVAQAVFTARQYTRQRRISAALQRRQLPATLARIAGVDTAIVYEPHGEGQTVGGDFYDIFPMGEDRWCFLLGDVQGKDPEAMSVTGLARHLVRLLAREGHGVESVLGRLNVAMAEESAEAFALGAELTGSRFLSLLYGELMVDPGVAGARCTVASAGHPPPLHMFADGRVEPASEPQMLLGIDEGAEFRAGTFRLAPGETLLCVTDGVTERRCGNWQLDDNDGLADVLRQGMGLGAKALAEHVRRAAHDFGVGPLEDDLSVLVLQAVAGDSRERRTWTSTRADKA